MAYPERIISKSSPGLNVKAKHPPHQPTLHPKATSSPDPLHIPTLNPYPRVRMQRRKGFPPGHSASCRKPAGIVAASSG